MKKLLLLVVPFLLAGCASPQESAKSGVLKCSVNQGTVKMSSSFFYDKTSDIADTQSQINVITMQDKDSYDAFWKQLQDLEAVRAFSSMKGVDYSLEHDDDTFTITEKIDMDLHTVSTEDYNIITYGDVNNKEQESPLISISQTKTDFEADGYSCQFS